MKHFGKRFKWLCAVIIVVLLQTVLLSVSVSAQEQVWPEAPELDGEGVVLIEANTGALIYEKNPDQKLYPASTTKILTAIVVLENCSLDETVTFTEECCDLEEGAVTIDSVPGEEMILKDVLYGLLLPSGNDCAMALALHVAGSIDRFADMMNAKAEQIGTVKSHFSNPSGLFDSTHYTTASDLALIAQYAFHNSTFVDIISHPTYIIEPTNMTPDSRVLTNTHEMIIPNNPDYNKYVIGGKTGYLYEAGRCLVTYGEKDGITLISVILNGSYYGIFNETQELLDFGWDHFHILNISEEERRFSYASEDAKVQIDPTDQILGLNDVPFYELTSRINYAYYLDETEYAEAKEAAGILPGDSRQLYAWIDYSYAGHYLGQCHVIIDPDLDLGTASFIHVMYVNIWLIILIAILVVLLVIFLVRLAKKSASEAGRLSALEHRRHGRSQVRYYSRSDSIDLREQYVKSGQKDRESVHRLREIGVDSRSSRRAKSTRSQTTGSRTSGSRTSRSQTSTSQTSASQTSASQTSASHTSRLQNRSSSMRTGSSSNTTSGREDSRSGRTTGSSRQSNKAGRRTGSSTRATRSSGAGKD